MAGSNEGREPIEVCGVLATYKLRDPVVGAHFWRGRRGNLTAHVIYQEGAARDAWYIRVREGEDTRTWATADTLEEAVNRATVGLDIERGEAWR